jgi:transposase
MKFVQALPPALPPDQRATLQQMHKHGPTHRVRQRAQAILLSARGYKIDQLARIFACDRDTISQWLDLFSTQGLAALSDVPKSGRLPRLDTAAQRVVQQEAAQQHPTPHLKATLLARLKKRAERQLGHG